MAKKKVKKLNPEELDQYQAQRGYVDQFDSFNTMIKNGLKLFESSMRTKYDLSEEYDVNLSNGEITEKPTKKA